MRTKMTYTGRAELTSVVRRRYIVATGAEKRKILDEFTAVTGYHEEFAIRELIVLRDASDLVFGYAELPAMAARCAPGRQCTQVSVANPDQSTSLALPHFGQYRRKISLPSASAVASRAACSNRMRGDSTMAMYIS